MLRPETLVGLRLRGGFLIAQIEFSDRPLRDALGRDAAAQTTIIGHRFFLRLRDNLAAQELSITLYHEILEAATVSVLHAPRKIVDFNEGDFEQAARRMHADWGEVSLQNLNLMLQLHGFLEE